MDCQVLHSRRAALELDPGGQLFKSCRSRLRARIDTRQPLCCGAGRVRLGQVVAGVGKGSARKSSSLDSSEILVQPRQDNLHELSALLGHIVGSLQYHVLFLGLRRS